MRMRILESLKQEFQIIENEQEKGVALNQTAFYPGGGGQPPDRGFLSTLNGKILIKRARMLPNGVVLHLFQEKTFPELSVDEKVKGQIDWDYRYAVMQNHTSAHLMAEAVRQVLGKPVEIVGSGLEANKVRLDFAYSSSLRPLFSKIEKVANNVVKDNRPVIIKTMRRNDAEKYLERFHESLKILPSHVTEVRIVEIEDWHACACGGTHVKHTGEIGFIKLLSRSSKGKGVERIEFAASQSP